MSGATPPHGPIWWVRVFFTRVLGEQTPPGPGVCGGQRRPVRMERHGPHGCSFCGLRGLEWPIYPEGQLRFYLKQVAGTGHGSKPFSWPDPCLYAGRGGLGKGAALKGAGWVMVSPCRSLRRL